MGWSDNIVTTYLDRDILLPAIGQVHLVLSVGDDKNFRFTI